MTSTPKEFAFVQDSDTLSEVIELIRPAELLAIDTEFVRERTYYAELCVLQIATEDVLVAIDCLARIDLEPLFQALVDNERCWLLHSARQDLEVLLERTGRRPARLIDTQIASALLGSSLQVGLQGLLADVLQVAIAKEHTRTDWSRRPLSSDAFAYAIDDVRYLLAAWRELERRLDEKARLSWFAEDCDRQLKLPIQPDPASILERTKGSGSLSGRQRSAALALVTWRENRAKQSNKPRRWILADDALVRMAAGLPGSREDLEAVRDLPQRFVARHGVEIVAAIASAEPAPHTEARPAPDKSIVKAIQAEVRSRAEAIGIQPELLATRKDIAMAATGQTPEILSTGWRSEVLGDALEKLT